MSPRVTGVNAAQHGVARDTMASYDRSIRRMESQGRDEVEDLVKERGSADHLAQVKARARLAAVDRELRRHRKEIKALEGQRAALFAELGEQPTQ